jgi:two-component system, NarL family, response regulator LiaR
MGNMVSRNKLVILYGASLAGILVLMKWLEFRFVVLDHGFEIYIGAIAVIFTGLGIWLAIKFSKPTIHTVIIEKEIYIAPDPPIIPANEPNGKALAKLGISKREWEVLVLMAAGLSNQEIANRLFVSLNTIKTHSSRLFEKLEAKRRTQAIEKAKKLGILY